MFSSILRWSIETRDCTEKEGLRLLHSVGDLIQCTKIAVSKCRSFELHTEADGSVIGSQYICEIKQSHGIHIFLKVNCLPSGFQSNLYP